MTASCPLTSPRDVRTLFLSDLHLGALGARPERVLALLRSHPAQTYVLAGDILDLWQPLLPHWTDADQAVIDHLNARAEAGARLVWLRGNHDPDPLAAPRSMRLRADPVASHLHEAADGRRYLVIHGDEADGRMVRAHLFTRLGSRLDHMLRQGETALRLAGPGLPNEARSPVEALLNGLNALLYMGRSHERRLVAMARAQGLDGVICGHFHIAGLHEDHGLVYANCGDWVDSMTALAEWPDGTLHLMTAEPRRLAARIALPAILPAARPLGV